MRIATNGSTNVVKTTTTSAALCQAIDGQAGMQYCMSELGCQTTLWKTKNGNDMASDTENERS